MLIDCYLILCIIIIFFLIKAHTDIAREEEFIFDEDEEDNVNHDVVSSELQGIVNEIRAVQIPNPSLPLSPSLSSQPTSSPQPTQI